jgi:hypothetical protein
MTLFADFGAFYLEHARCDDVESAVDGDRVWTTRLPGSASRARRRPSARSGGRLDGRQNPPARCPCG